MSDSKIVEAVARIEQELVEIKAELGLRSAKPRVVPIIFERGDRVVLNRKLMHDKQREFLKEGMVGDVVGVSNNNFWVMVLFDEDFKRYNEHPTDRFPTARKCSFNELKKVVKDA